MPFTDIQKARFIALLQSKGWEWRDETIWSPSGGLAFCESHFDWSPQEMQEIFTARSARIAKSQIGDWQTGSRENHEAAWAAEEAAKL